ncbi:hypothetical protein [Actinoallomurus acanthiterrae]
MDEISPALRVAPRARRGTLSRVELHEAVHLWEPTPGYLNTASYGLPPRTTLEAVRRVLGEWQCGDEPWSSWDVSTGRAREEFTRLVGAQADDIAVGAAVSQQLAPVAASLPTGAHVVVPEIEFTSNLFPWLVQDVSFSVLKDRACG